MGQILHHRHVEHHLAGHLPTDETDGAIGAVCPPPADDGVRSGPEVRRGVIADGVGRRVTVERFSAGGGGEHLGPPDNVGEQRTHVEMRADYKLRGSSRFGGFMVRRATRRQLEEALSPWLR